MNIRFRPALFAFLSVSAASLAPAAHAQDDYQKTWRGVAALRTQNINQATRTMLAVYPVFTSRRRVAQVAGATLKKQALSRYAAFEKQSQGTSKQLGLSSGIKYEFEVKPYLEWNRPRLICATLLNYSFEGGAHGLGYTTGYVFGTPVGAKSPRQLHVADFFTSGIASTRKHLNAIMMAKLRASKGTDHEAMWVQDGTVKSVTNAQMENFIASPTGLKWFFAPYEMGPFANGEYELTLSPRELGPTFRANMLR